MAGCSARLDRKDGIVNVRRSDAGGARDQACSGQSRAQARWRRADIDQAAISPISEFDGVLGEASVESVTSRGKALLMRFDNGLTLYSHSQLYGRWTVNRVTTKVRWNRSLRAEFISKGYTVRLWSATDVEVVPTRDEEAHPYIAKLGPDVLDKTTTPDVIKNRLRALGSTVGALHL